MNLLESLNKTQTQRAAEPIPGQTANLRQMLAAKSGKAGATSGPAISNVAEQQALVDFNQAATQQQQAGQARAEQTALQQQAQNQQFSQGRQRLGLQKSKQEQQFEQAADKIANNLERFKDDLASKEGQQALAETLFARRLADKQYMTDLSRAGQERRLNDQNAFALEAGKSAFENWKEIFANEDQFARMMDADNAEFQKGLAQMNIETAKAVLADNMKAANLQAQYGAIGSFGTAMIQGAVKADEKGFFD